MNIDQLLANINRYIINPFITFLFVLASLLFLYGLTRYYIMGDAKEKETGRQHMVWGLIGMFIMMSVFGIMNLIMNTFGIDVSQFGAKVP